MPLITWSVELEIGIPEVDDEHKKLVAILNQLDEAKKAGKGTRIMGTILGQLVEYTQVHFASEEKLMTDASYPDLHLHQRQHQQLVDKVEHFQQEFGGDGRRITGKMMEFLKYWLTNHILVDDMAFGRFRSQVGS